MTLQSLHFFLGTDRFSSLVQSKLAFLRLFFRPPLLLLIAVLSTTLPIKAQEVLGRSVINGRVVDLLDDHTWKFVETRLNSCRSISQEMEFCQKGTEWELMPGYGTQYAAEFEHGLRYYATIDLERIGSDDGASLDSMQSSLLDMVSQIANIPLNDVIIHEFEPEVVSGFPGETLVYRVYYQGINYLYATTFVLTNDVSIWIDSWQPALDFDDKHKSLHANLLESIQINGKSEGE